MSPGGEHSRIRRKGRAGSLLFLALTASPQARALNPVGGGDRGPRNSLAMVQRTEDDRVEVIRRTTPAVVAIFDGDQRGGGSGVLIGPEGYGLTNYHVVAGLLDTRTGLGGLSDGQLYPLHVLGIDPIGDVAMFRLSGREEFPFAVLGDSDAVSVGDPVLAMGNPFVLSEDYTPTVTFGRVTGIHRYQHGSKGNLIYSDCLQVDASINPGNSGGPLFNARGEIIGLNGRISVNTRGRFNVGLGYAITSNQLKRFIPALRAGLLATHGTLQATVESDRREVTFSRVMPDGAADRAGLRMGDRLVMIDGVQVQSPNHVASLLGTYPGGWTVFLDVLSGSAIETRVVPLDRVPPRLPRPFVEDPAVNQTQVLRIMDSFRRTHGSWDVGERELRWSIRREVWIEGTSTNSECLVGRLDTRNRVSYATPAGFGGSSPLLEFDLNQAVQRVDGFDQPLLPPLEDQLMAVMVYLLQVRVYMPWEEIVRDDPVHEGGDMCPASRFLGLKSQPSLETGSPDSVRDPSTRGRPVEVVTWEVGGDARTRVAFDAQTLDIRRIDVRDFPSSISLTMVVIDYDDVMGVRRPVRWVVRGRSREIAEEWFDWSAGS